MAMASRRSGNVRDAARLSGESVKLASAARAQRGRRGRAGQGPARVPVSGARQDQANCSAKASVQRMADDHAARAG